MFYPIDTCNQRYKTFTIVINESSLVANSQENKLQKSSLVIYECKGFLKRKKMMFAGFEPRPAER